jgi:hypothetical protein
MTCDGVEHKTISIKADYIRKIDYSAPSEASESKAAKPAKKKAKLHQRILEAALRSCLSYVQFRDSWIKLG